MNVKDLWVGDEVILLKSNRVGIYLGLADDRVKARIRVEDKIIRVKGEGLELAPERKISKLEELGFEVEEISNVQKRIEFIPEIDLHIEKLQNSKKNENPTAILEFQLRKLHEFLDRAVDLRIPKVTIIHGRGTGVLKMETFNILESYLEKKSLYPVNNEGGVDVYFQY